MKKILFIVLVFPLIALAIWYNPLTWFQDNSEQKLGAGVIAVINGGTGAQTFAIGECLKGNGTGAITTGACGTGSSSFNYDAFTHPLIGESATTSIMNFTGGFNSSGSSTILKLGNLSTNGFVKTSGGDGTLGIDTSTYLTGNQSITLSGDVSGTGATAITTVIGAGKVTPAMLDRSYLTAYDAFTHPLVGESATTTILNMAGFNTTASSTIGGTLQVASTATSTFAGGLNIKAFNAIGGATSTITTGLRIENGGISISGSIYCLDNPCKFIGSNGVSALEVDYNTGIDVIYGASRLTVTGSAIQTTIASAEIGRWTATGLGIFDTSPTFPLDVTGAGRFSSLVDASHFVGTTTATSTFAGGLSVGGGGLASSAGVTVTAGSINCTTCIPNASLLNSTISGVSLGGTLGALTAGSGLSAAGTYTGATARTFSLDLSATNAWTSVSTTTFTGGLSSAGFDVTTSGLRVSGGNLNVSAGNVIVVGSSAGTGVVNIKNTSIGIRETLYLTRSTTGGLAVVLNDTASGGRQYEFYSTDAGSTEGSGKFVFFDGTANSARLTIDSTGFVGVGTTTPTYIFSVQGNSLISGTSTVKSIFATSSIMLGSFSVTPDGLIAPSNFYGRSISKNGYALDADAELYTRGISYNIASSTMGTSTNAASFQFPVNALLTEVNCSTDAGIAEIQLDRRTSKQPMASSTFMLQSYLTCDMDTASTTSFHADLAGAVNSGNDLVLRIERKAGTSSIPTLLKVNVKYTAND